MNRNTVCWLAYKNLPFNFFDDDVTQKFFGLINSTIKMPKKTSMQQKSIAEFEKMQSNLKRILATNSSKFSFTVDAWSSKSFQSFYGITIHFIDNDWTLQSFALDLVASEGKHKGSDIAKLFFQVVKFFEIQDRIQGITVDNASANETFMENLGVLMEKENFTFNHEDQHFRCYAHILNLAVQDILKLINTPVEEDGKLTIEETEDIELEDIETCEFVNTDCNDDSERNGDFAGLILKIRNTCKKIRQSEVLTNKLKNFCEAVNVKYIKPILDVRTRWNSTCDMLDIAFKLKSALMMLWEHCSNLKEFKIEENEWSIIQNILEFLKYFKQVCKIVSCEKKVTLPNAVVAFNMLLDKIELIVKNLDDKLDRDSNDEKLLLAFQAGRDKLVKHYQKCNWIYAMVLILDPRHKVMGFDSTKWGRDLKQTAVEKFETIFKEIYYEKSDENDKNMNEEINTDDDFLNFDSIYVKSSSFSNWKKEVNDYLETPRASGDTKILEWWKNHSQLYVNLSKMARDFLCIMPSSVPVERLFSEASAIVTNDRCSLKYKSIRSLICTNSWMKCNLKELICEVNM